MVKSFSRRNEINPEVWNGGSTWLTCLHFFCGIPWKTKPYYGKVLFRDWFLGIWFQSGAVFNRAFQPYESHIPYLLHFLVSKMFSCFLFLDLWIARQYYHFTSFFVSIQSFWCQWVTWFYTFVYLMVVSVEFLFRLITTCMEWDIYMSKTSSFVLHCQMIFILSHLFAGRWIVLLYRSSNKFYMFIYVDIKLFSFEYSFYF